jgi:hypothetical protein
MSEQVFGWIIQGGSFAVLVYMILWALPKERKETLATFSAELAEERQTCAGQHREVMEELEKDRAQRALQHGENRGDLNDLRHRLNNTHHSVVAHHQLVDTVVNIRRKEDPKGAAG